MASETDIETPEIRLALFGESGSGKTTLLASYYGHQTSSQFEGKHQYRLEATSTRQSNELLARFNRLKEGAFPKGTNVYAEYVFDMHILDLTSPSMRIVWYDYPGGWWTQDTNTDDEARAKLNAFSNLLSSHVAILLIDGEKYAREGAAELRRQLRNFKVEIQRVMAALAKNGKPISEMPENWILAFSKADLLAKGITASDLGMAVHQHAKEEVSGIRKILKDRTNFGSNYLLLSSVEGQNGGITNASKYMGIQLLAPVAFWSTLKAVADREAKRRDTKALGGAQWLLSHLRELLTVVDRFDDFLPKKYQVITKILKALPLGEWASNGEEYFREKQRIAASKGKATEALASALAAELSSEAAKGQYGSIGA